jgi:hypothetical protein
MGFLVEGKNGKLWRDVVGSESDDEHRREIGKEAPYLLDFMIVTAMICVHWTLYSLTGRRGVCMLRGRLCQADRKYRICAQTVSPLHDNTLS